MLTDRNARLAASRSAEDFGTNVDRFSIVFHIHGQLGLLHHSFQPSVFPEMVRRRIVERCLLAFRSGCDLCFLLLRDCLRRLLPSQIPNELRRNRTQILPSLWIYARTIEKPKIAIRGRQVPDQRLPGIRIEPSVSCRILYCEFVRIRKTAAVPPSVRGFTDTASRALFGRWRYQRHLRMDFWP